MKNHLPSFYVMVPKVHWYIIDPHLGPPMGSNWPQSAKKGKTYWHFIETILSGNVQTFYAYSHSSFGILLNFLIAEKIEKFLQIFFLEIFKLDFRIPGKILNGFLVQHIFWCLVTSMIPRGVTEVTKHQKMNCIKIPLKILPGIRKSNLKISRTRFRKNFLVCSVIRKFNKIPKMGCEYA